MDHKKLLSEIKEIAAQLENGKTFSTAILLDRFNKVASHNSKDIFLNSYRDSLKTLAKNQEFVDQKKLTSLYNSLYSFNGKNSVFKEHFGDLLLESYDLKKSAHPQTTRVPLEKKIESVNANQDLSDAFSVLFSIGSNSAVSPYNPIPNRNVEKAVFNKFNSLGYRPNSVKVLETSETYSICSVGLKTANNKNVFLLTPLFINKGIVQEPQHIVNAENEVEDLNEKSLYLTLKQKEKTNKVSTASADTRTIEPSKVELPEALKDVANIDKVIIAATNNFEINKINLASNMLSLELKSIGARYSNIKLADSNQRELLFDVNLHTKVGSATIQVPVEIPSSGPVIPDKFYTAGLSENIFSFSSDGLNRFFECLTPESAPVIFSRDSGELSKMSFAQLSNEILEGVASKEYSRAENALSVIEKRFGRDKYLEAHSNFSNLIRKTATVSNERQVLIEKLIKSGDIIKRANSSEYFCVSLGLPLSKVTFDEVGRPISIYRAKLNKLSEK